MFLFEVPRTGLSVLFRFEIELRTVTPVRSLTVDLNISWFYLHRTKGCETQEPYMYVLVVIRTHYRGFEQSNVASTYNGLFISAFAASLISLFQRHICHTFN
jgi:hypothetical protein